MSLTLVQLGYYSAYNPGGYSQDSPAYNAFQCFSLFIRTVMHITKVVISRTILRITSGLIITQFTIIQSINLKFFLVALSI